MNGRAVLWGARHNDWQVGGPYDLQRQKLLGSFMVLRLHFRDRLTPSIRRAAAEFERLARAI